MSARCFYNVRFRALRQASQILILSNLSQHTLAESTNTSTGIMKFSPTTLISYAQAAVVIAIVSRPLYLYWTVENYNAVVGLAVASTLAVTATTILGVAKGHFTQDAPVVPKPDTTTTINP